MMPNQYSDEYPESRRPLADDFMHLVDLLRSRNSGPQEENRFDDEEAEIRDGGYWQAEARRITAEIDQLMDMYDVATKQPRVGRRESYTRPRRRTEARLVHSRPDRRTDTKKLLMLMVLAELI